MKTEKKKLSAEAANVIVEIEIAAPVAKTWKTMIDDITLWWRKDFLVCEGSLGMHLDPRIGGLLHERTADEGCGFVWGTVTSFQPESHLCYVGNIVPPWGGPAQSVVQIALEAAEGDADATVLKLTDSLIGHLSHEMMDSLDEGWGQLYGEGGLKTFVEGR